MKIISIGMDRRLFVRDSAVQKRMIEYGRILGELHIVVFSQYNLGFSAQQISPNVWLYPTNSANKLWYMFDAYRVAKGILSQVFFGQVAITAQDPFATGLVGVWLKRFFKLPLQVQIHTDAWNPQYKNQGLRTWFEVSVIAQFVLKRATGVRVVSDKIGRDVIINTKLPFNKVFVLPVFVDTAAYVSAQITKDMHSVYPSRSPIVLMASRLTAEKNIPLAFKAFKSFLKKYPQALLVIVGDGPERSRLERFVRFHGLKQNVAFEDWQMDMASYMKTADIFLNTSNYEGYGMTLVEAGAANCALITTKVGIAGDVLEDGRNALVCPAGDADCINTKLAILAENNHFRKVLANELQKNILATALTKDQYLQRMKLSFDVLFQ